MAILLRLVERKGLPLPTGLRHCCAVSTLQVSSELRPLHIHSASGLTLLPTRSLFIFFSLHWCNGGHTVGLNKAKLNEREVNFSLWLTQKTKDEFESRLCEQRPYERDSRLKTRERGHQVTKENVPGDKTLPTDKSPRER